MTEPVCHLAVTEGTLCNLSSQFEQRLLAVLAELAVPSSLTLST